MNVCELGCNETGCYSSAKSSLAREWQKKELQSHYIADWSSKENSMPKGYMYHTMFD